MPYEPALRRLRYAPLIALCLKVLRWSLATTSKTTSNSHVRSLHLWMPW